MDTVVGDNAAAMLRSLIDRLCDLRVGEAKLKADRKAVVEDLDNEGFPVKYLMAEPETADDVAVRKTCAVVMGHTVYAEELPEDDAAALLAEISQERVDFVTRQLSDLKGITDGLLTLKEETKKTLKEVKAAGYAPRVVKILVDFQMNPKKAMKFDKDSPLLSAYRRAINQG